MTPRPSPLCCSRCRAPIDARTAAEQRLRFDAHDHALCSACWEAFASFINAKSRVRIGEAA
jgi:hypothetical protein